MVDARDTLPGRFKNTVENYPHLAATMSRNGQGEFETLTYLELYSKVEKLAERLHRLGVNRGDHVGLISDNRTEWLIADLSVICLGGVDVPRGSDSTEEEIAFILGHSDCSVTFAENRTQVEKIINRKSELTKLRTIIAFDDEESERVAAGVTIIGLPHLIDRGRQSKVDDPLILEEEIRACTSDDVVTIIYTSGTTGEPKGVMLTSRSYTFQLDRLVEHLHISAGQVYLSILPAWHSFERAVEYVAINSGAAIAYSKPVGPVLMSDMAELRPHWLAAVPRIWDGVRAAVYRRADAEGGLRRLMFHFFLAVCYAHAALWTRCTGRRPQFRRGSVTLDILLCVAPLAVLSPLRLLGNALVFAKLKRRFGGRFVAGISGGGSLPPRVDRFFRAAGILLLEGYGLTETGPVLSVRKQSHPVPGTVGPLLRQVEGRILAPDRSILGPGQRGVLFVKSEQLMKGYYKRPEATEAILKDGWLNTGDIAVFTYQGELRIVGREKETIVLLGGENVEPIPIEEKLAESEVIEQAMIVGQDQKFLAALIVPDFDSVEGFATKQAISFIDRRDLLESPTTQELFQTEIRRLVSLKAGFKPFELVFRFKLLEEPFRVGIELTHTLKVRRQVVAVAHRKELADLFA